MKIAATNYTIPVLKMSKPVSNPKLSKKAQQAASRWFVEFFFKNPETNKNERFRPTNDLNRIKDYDQKFELFKAYENQLSAMLKCGWSPFGENADLKNTIIALTLKQAKEEFLEYHQNKNSRKKTVISFKSKVGLMVDHFGEDKKVTEITTVDITKMMLKFEKEKGWEAATFVNARAAYTNFFNYLKSTGRIEKSPFDEFGEKRKITESEAHIVFSDEHFNLIKAWLKDYDYFCYMCITILYNTCLRPGELRLLETKYVDIEKKKITVIGKIAKNGKTATIGFDDNFQSILRTFDFSKQYLVGHPETNTGNAITGNEKVSEKMIYRRLMNCLEALKLDKMGYTLYSIKHLSNYRKAKSGNFSLFDIAVGNRHSDLKEVQTYLRKLMNETPETKPMPAM